MIAHLFGVGPFPFCTASGKLPDPRRSVGMVSLFAKKIKRAEAVLNCTPFVRQYGILNNKWGV